MKKKILIGGILLLVISVFAVNAQTSGRFFQRMGDINVYKLMESPAQFLAEGGDWSKIEIFDEPAVGSVNLSNEYQATSTWVMVKSAPATAKTQRLVQTAYQSSSVILGSVVIASSSASTFKIWNATSTSDVSSTTLMNFKASTAEGTYTFDAVMTRGLVVEMPIGYNGNFVVTFR